MKSNDAARPEVETAYKEYASVGEAASILGVSIDTVRRWDKRGFIKSERLDGKNRYFAVEDLEAFKATQQLSTTEVAKQLGVSTSTVRRLETQGLLVPSRDAQGQRMYEEAAVTAYLAAKTAEVTVSEVQEIPHVHQADLVMADEVAPAPSLVAPAPRHASRPRKQPLHHIKHTSKRTIEWMAHLKLWQKILLWAGLALLSLMMLFALLFLVAPGAMARMLGYQTVNDPNGSHYVASRQPSLLSRALSPITNTALNAAGVINPDLDTKVQKQAGGSNPYFTLNKDGQVQPKYALDLPNSSYLQVPDQGLVINLNSQYVDGYKPGTGVGNLAVLPISGNQIQAKSITGSNIADGTIQLANLSASAISSLRSSGGGGAGSTFVSGSGGSSTPGPEGPAGPTGPQGPTGAQGATGLQGLQGTTGPGTVETVVAGNGLYGGGSSSTVTLNVSTGNSTVISNGDVEVKVASSGTSSTTSSTSGLEVTSQGLRLLGGCSTNQILVWNGSGWACAAQASGGGSLTVQASDGSITATNVATLNFGPTSGSSSEFNVTNTGGGGVRVQLGTNVLQTTNYATTLDPIYVNENQSPASGDISGTYSSGLQITANAVALGTDTTGNYVATVAGGNGITVSGSGSESAGISLGLSLANSGVTGTSSGVSGLEIDGSGALRLLGGCSSNQILKFNGTAWACASDNNSPLNVKKNSTTVTTAATDLNFSSDFDVSNAVTQASIGLDYTASGITRRGSNETIVGNWSFNDSSFSLQDNADTTKKVGFELSGLTSGTTRTLSVPNASGTLISTGNLADVTAVGTITSGTWQGSTIATQYGGTGATSFTSKGILYGNGTGAIQAAIAGTDGQFLVADSSGTPSFVDLGGDATLASNGNLTLAKLQGETLATSGVGVGNALIYNGSAWVNQSITGDITIDGLGVATIGAGAVSNADLANNSLTVTAGTGLSGGGNVALGGTTTLSVQYGSTSGTAVSGDTTLTCSSGVGNLGGGGNVITLGAGGTCSDITMTASPTFSDLTVTTGGADITGTVTLNSLNTAGVVHTNGAGVLSTSAVVLGTDTSGDYVTNLGTLVGLSTSGNSGVGSTPGLSVLYGAIANTAVSGDTTLICPTGTGNLTGGGGTITLGNGGDCGTLDVVGSPALSGTLAVDGGSITVGTASQQGSLILNDGLGAVGRIQLNGLGQNTVYNLPDSGQASVDICLSTGNCTAVGAAGGDLTGNYPNPTIAKLQNNTLTLSSVTGGQILQYNGSAFVNQTLTGDITIDSSGVTTIGAGKISDSNLQAGTFANITGTGALSAGSIASGFGAISTGNNITTTADIQGDSIDAVTGFTLGGVDINTGGTLSNVAYLDQANTFSAANTFGAAGTALTVTNDAYVGGTLTATNLVGALTGNASTATALAANPSDCSANQFATTIAANGNLTCASITDGDIPNSITIDLATTATALAANPTDCSANQFANAIAANGNLTCAGITDADVSDTLTSSLFVGSGSTTTAIDLATAEVAGNLKATNLQAGALDLGGADVNINLTNSNAGGFVTNLTLDGTITAATFAGALSGNATTATALAANPSDCSANQFATTIAASGNLTCAALTDGDIPDSITITNATNAANLIGSGSTTNAVDLATAEVAGNLKASNLQLAAANLGAADVNLDFSNSNGAFVTNLTLDGTITAATFSGALTGNASTATALAANPSDCSANQFATTIAANGNLTCASITDGDIPNSITIDLATTATALAANPTDCSANQFANAIAANGNLTCAGITDADVSDTLTSSLFVGSGSTTTAIDLATAEVAGNLKATNLQAGALDLGGADVNINLTNSNAGGFVTNLTLDGTITAATFAGALSGNATTATALAANPSDCSANQFATTIAASGNLTCASIAANNLPSAAANLGAADVTINLGNTNGAFNTNLTLDGTVTAATFIGALTGNASTATALAANPTDCSANQFANAIAANGNLTCAGITDADVSDTLTSSLFVGSGSTTTAIDLATAEVAGNLKATNLQAGALDLGGADVNINLTNSNAGGFVTNLTLDGTITAATFAGALSGNATTATALAANPSDCSANQFATTIAASGNLTCAALTDGDIPDSITITNATNAANLIGSGSTTNAVDLATAEVAGNLKASNLQLAAANLGAADVNLDFSNSNGAFVTNLTLDGTITAATFSGALTGNASTATALAANPSDCSANQFATTIAANGNLTCASITDGDIPNSITIDLATTATALAANPTDCSANQFANAIAANGNLTCAGITDADVSDTLTSSLFVGSGSTTTAIDLATAEVAGNLKATNLQAGALDLGGADVNINLTNSNAGGFVTNLTLDGTITAATFAGALSGNATTATALAANPSDCSANQFATTIAASGNLTCAALTDGDIPDSITITNATNAANLIGSGSTTNAVDLATAEVAGNLKASNLQLAAANLGAADVNLDFSNSNGAFVTNLTLDGTITAATFSGALTGNASTATALAANPSDCSANQFATTIAANGNLTCASITDGDIPNSITIDLATTATALAANPTDCSANQFANAIAANGNLTCAGITDADVSDTLTSSLFVGSGSTTTAIDLATAEVAGNLKATNLQAGALDLGGADVNINFSNSNAGGFVTNLTLDGTITAATFAGALSGNATTATALAANPSDCSANQFATTIAASGNLTCAALTDGDIPDSITITNATNAANLIGSGSTTNAVDLATAEVAGNLKASNLQLAAANLGAADVNLDFSNSNGAFVTNLTLDGTITAATFSGALTGNASTATALAANPSDCSANQFATTIAANGNLTCASITDGDIPNSITIDLATTATALAANPTDCSANQFANAIAANGNLTCAGITDADVSDTLTSSLFVGSGSTTTAIDLATAEVAGNLKATNLQAGALDLGGADVNINFSNSNAGGFVTNLTLDGTLTSGLINGQTISSSANFTGTLAVASTINGATISSSAVNGLTFSGTAITGSGALTINANGASSLSISSGGVANTVYLGNTGAAGAVAQTINIGTNSSAAGTNTIVIGNSSATASTVSINGGTGASALGLQVGAAGTISIGTTVQTTTLSVGNTSASTAISINGGTGASALGLQVGASGTIKVGTTVQTSTLNLGNTSASATTLINGGTGASAIALTPGVNGSVILGATTGTGAITLGRSTGAETINIGNVATAAGSTHTISIGATNNASTGVTAINIGNTNSSTGANTVTIKAGGSGGSAGPSITLGATASTSAVCSALATGTAPTAGTAYELRDCSGAPVQDYAEMYPTDGSSNYGDILMLGTQNVQEYDTDGHGSILYNAPKHNVTQLVKASQAYGSVIGVVSNNYGDFTSTGYGVIDPTDHPMPIALNGRVPVNISPDSAPIAAGDYITVSNTNPGMGTKATHAGMVIGKALASWTPGFGQSQVIVFVEQGYYPGPSSAGSLADNTNNSGGTNDATIDNLTVNDDTTLKDLFVKAIHGQGSDGLEIDLDDGQKVSIRDKNGNDQAVFDALGNATFNGTVTGDSFVSQGIDIGESLTALSDSVSDLSDKVQQLQQNSSNTGGSNNGMTDANGQPVNFNNLAVGELHINLDTIADGGLTVNGPAEFKGTTLFDQLVTFAAPVDFSSDIHFNGGVSFNNNTGGYAIIAAGKTAVHVSFSQAYPQPPIISLTPGDSSSASAHYENVTAGGFDIVLAQPVAQDTHLSWLAISVTGANTFIQQ